jgi:opacity protein-like surface antigen
MAWRIIGEQLMNRAGIASGWWVAAGLALHGSIGVAQEHGSQEVQIYGGEIFGDRLTETPVSGSTPRLNDAAAIGARYNFNFSEKLGAQLEVGYSPRVTTGHVDSGNSDGVIVQCDLDVVWNMATNYRVYGHSVVPYAVAGGGYAWSLNLHRTIQVFVDTAPVSIDQSNGYTVNAGPGVKYYVTGNMFVDFNGRYRYFSRLVTDFGQGLNTAETSLGFGWRF